jgi:hypothetical protein
MPRLQLTGIPRVDAAILSAEKAMGEEARRVDIEKRLARIEAKLDILIAALAEEEQEAREDLSGNPVHQPTSHTHL